MIHGGISWGVAAAVLALVLFMTLVVRDVHTSDGPPILACAPTTSDPNGLRLPCFR